MNRPVAENNKAGGFAPSTARRSMFHSTSRGAVNKDTEHHELSSDKVDYEMSSERIAYGCKVLTEKYNIDPILARNFFVDETAWLCSNGRKNNAQGFLKEYDYGRCKDRKTCIWPEDTLSWQDESSGTIWVGVHGTDSICVVTRSGDLDVTRLRGRLAHLPTHKVFFEFRKSLIVEIEDFANSYSKLRQRFQQKIEKPFSVVSVIPDTNNKQAHPTEYGERKAMEFLKEKLNSNTVFTVNETIQTAICTFQHLFQKKFNTDEILVSVMDPEYIYNVRGYPPTYERKDPTIEELNMSQMREHLDVINKPFYNEKIESRREEEDSSSSGSPKHQEWKLQECGGLSETRRSTITD